MGWCVDGRRADGGMVLWLVDSIIKQRSPWGEIIWGLTGAVATGQMMAASRPCRHRVLGGGRQGEKEREDPLGRGRWGGRLCKAVLPPEPGDRDRARDRASAGCTLAPPRLPPSRADGGPGARVRGAPALGSARPGAPGPARSPGRPGARGSLGRLGRRRGWKGGLQGREAAQRPSAPRWPLPVDVGAPQTAGPSRREVAGVPPHSTRVREPAPGGGSGRTTWTQSLGWGRAV